MSYLLPYLLNCTGTSQVVVAFSSFEDYMRFESKAIEPEHLLLSIVRCGMHDIPCRGFYVLDQIVGIPELFRYIETHLTAGDNFGIARNLSASTIQIFENAIVFSRDINEVSEDSAGFGTGGLLMAIINSPNNTARGIVADCQIDFEHVQDLVRRCPSIYYDDSRPCVSKVVHPTFTQVLFSLLVKGLSLQEICTTSGQPIELVSGLLTNNQNLNVVEFSQAAAEYRKYLDAKENAVMEQDWNSACDCKIQLDKMKCQFHPRLELSSNALLSVFEYYCSQLA